MFSAFKKSIPELSIFHNPASPPSTKALAVLQSALTSSYPPGKQGAPPLRFNLEVVENTPPTADQIRTILKYLPTAEAPEDASDPHHLSKFLSAHPAAPSLQDQPHSAEGLVRLANSNPTAVKWPIVVDWTSGKACVGNSGCAASILEHLRKKRDGEIKDEEDYKPKGWFS